MVLHEAPDPRDFIMGGALRPCPYAPVAAPGTGSGSGISFGWRRQSNGAPAWAGQPVWEQCVTSASSVWACSGLLQGRMGKDEEDLP